MNPRLIGIPEGRLMSIMSQFCAASRVIELQALIRTMEPALRGQTLALAAEEGAMDPKRLARVACGRKLATSFERRSAAHRIACQRLHAVQLERYHLANETPAIVLLAALLIAPLAAPLRRLRTV